jgi:HEAT repeat protein
VETRWVRPAVGAIALWAVTGALAGASRGARQAEPDVTLHVESGSAQDEAMASALLRSLAGTPFVACELVLHGLGNRWGTSAVRPRVHPPIAADEAQRGLAEWAWRDSPDPADAAALIDGLGSSDPCVQRVAARLLALLDDPVTVSAVSRQARSGTGRTRLAAIMSLGQVAREEATEVLAAGLHDPDADVRRASAWALAGSGRYAPLSALATALGDRDVVLRENAAWALGRLQRREAIDPLVRALRDAESDVRINAAWALGEIEDERAIPPLASLLGNDREPEVRRAAAWALGRIER